MMKRRKSKGLGWIKLIIVLILLLALGILVFTLVSNTNLINEDTQVQVQMSGEAQTTRTPDSSLQVNNIKSNHAILIRLEDGQLLYEKNKDGKVFPASLTKIMTGIVAIEHLEDLNTLITITPTTFDHLFAEGASMAGFGRNDDVKALDLLYGIMLPSGAEASEALAKHIAGSEEEFVHLMNAKSKELGLKNTNFVNTTGLHTENQFSTVEDISNLVSYALKDQTFKEIFTTKKYGTSPTQSQPDGITFESSVFSRLKNGYHLKHGEIIGGKTGYTPEAGLCLASLAVINGKEYMLVTANAQTKSNLENYHMDDAKKIYNAIPR